MADQEQIKQEFNNATIGLNMDQTPSQIKKGSLTYALNAAIENYDSNSINYQNEEGNELCLTFPESYVLIGTHFINERNKHMFFLTNPETGDCELGYMDNNDCQYKTLANTPCFGWKIDHPIHKIVHKITNCSTEIYWADNVARRYMDIDNPPYILQSGSPVCNPVYSHEIDCNQLKIQPNFLIPQLEVIDVVSGGNLTAGTYQFAIQYADAVSNPYSSYYSITNPTPIADPLITSVNFNYPVGKSIIINVSHLDLTGQFTYYNLAVIKTINGISSVELIGTYYIDKSEEQITYSGQDVTAIKLSIEDIFEKYPYYDLAEDLTAVQDVLIWDNLSSIDRVNYQKIANQITLNWETWRIPATEDYADEVNAANLRGYLRDEVYPFEIVFLLDNGKQTDGFHIPGRVKTPNEIFRPDVPDTDEDFIGTPDYTLSGIGYSPYWKIYNTATVTGFDPSYSADVSYKGPYQYGQFAYWESNEEYPCNADIWGSLAGQKIRHHKFPDVLVSPIMESKVFTGVGNMAMGDDAIFPIGVKVDVQQIQGLIASSDLSAAEKASMVGFKIVRGDRSTNKSIVAKGILRNVGEYVREDQHFYYPNYPYNDLKEDPFLTKNNNALSDLCQVYEVSITVLQTDPLGGPDYAIVKYTDCNTGLPATDTRYATDTEELCSTTKPTIESPAEGVVGLANYETWFIQNTSDFSGVRVGWIDPIEGYTDKFLCALLDPTCDHQDIIRSVTGTNGPYKVDGGNGFERTLISVHTPTENCGNYESQGPITDQERQIFNSPETSFGQPFLGTILKLESVLFGKGKAHFTQVKNNAKYRLISEDIQIETINTCDTIGMYSGDWDGTAFFTAYQSYLQIYINGISRTNFAYSFNSIADYNYCAAIPNDQQVKQRNVDIARYLIPGVQAIEPNGYNINNYQRETSVFVKTIHTLPFPDKSPNLLSGANSIISDNSRFTISQASNCDTPARETDIQVVSYYASIKNQVNGQWGQIYSYDTIDTGFQRMFDDIATYDVVFGGDTFIGRFAFKTKLPFFIDNRVDAPDDSDIYYDEIGNVAYPRYWHSARSVQKDYMSSGGMLSNIISYKAHNFDCPNDQVVSPIPISGTTTTTTTTTAVPVGDIIASDTITHYDGYFYLFAYGVPNFYCESSYNLDLRQAYNNREGDFWPHVSTAIPDDWVQQTFVPIAQDNTYTYNTTFSKQNKENFFSHIPGDWDGDPCLTNYPFRAIYSEQQENDADSKVNNWLTYAPLSYFDFPQNYGKLISLDGIQNKAILARFENKSLLYNNLLTVNTSNPQMAYMGNPGMFKGAPPIDFAETDLGYIGSQHKFLLKIPQGQITIDAKRGQVFLISGTQVKDLSGFGSGMNRFFTDHLAFEILRYFPEVDVDNHFNGIGLHGVYDSKYDRVIITKLDYIPHPEYADRIKYDVNTKEYYLETEVDMPDVTTTSTTTTRIPSSTTTSSTTSTTSSTSTTTSSTSTTTSSTSTTTTTEAPTTTTTSTSTTTTEAPTTTTSTTSSTTTTTTTGVPVDPQEFGYLYNWYTIGDARNVANTDWHVPDYCDYETLALNAGGYTVAGRDLKENTASYWSNLSWGGTNPYQWSARGAGWRYETGEFTDLKNMLKLWDAEKFTHQGTVSAIATSSYNFSNTSCDASQWTLENLKRGMSIRLVKDSTIKADGTYTVNGYTGNDGTQYDTIVVGTQEWIVKNLYETKYRNGDTIPQVQDSTTWSGLTTGAYSIYTV